MLSTISLLVSILMDDTVSALAFLPVLLLFLGLPVVSTVNGIRAIPPWCTLPLSSLIGLLVTTAVLSLDLLITSSSDHVVMVTSGISIMINALNLLASYPPRLPKGVVFKVRADRKAFVAALVFLILLLLVAFTILQPFPSKPLTEFYLLNENGRTTEMPYKISEGDDVNLIVGISNHEGRTMNYHVQIWLARMSSESDPNSTESMHHLDTFSVTLDHMPMPLSGQWVPQHQFEYNLTVPTDGPLRLWFFLFLDEVPYDLEDLDPDADRSDEGKALINMARERSLLNLSIQLNADAKGG